MATRRIVFGDDTNQIRHVFRHIEALGLDRSTVVEVIGTHLLANMPRPSHSRLFVGRVRVGGIELRYHAYSVTEDVVNVGRITGP